MSGLLWRPKDCLRPQSIRSLVTVSLQLMETPLHSKEDVSTVIKLDIELEIARRQSLQGLVREEKVVQGRRGEEKFNQSIENLTVLSAEMIASFVSCGNVTS